MWICTNFKLKELSLKDDLTYQVKLLDWDGSLTTYFVNSGFDVCVRFKLKIIYMSKR